MLKTKQLGAKQEKGFYEMVVLQGGKIGGIYLLIEICSGSV